MVANLADYQKVVGSIPTPATNHLNHLKHITMTTLTQDQFSTLKKAIYTLVMETNPDFGLGEGGEVEMMAESLINDWAEKENIAIQN